MVWERSTNQTEPDVTAIVKEHTIPPNYCGILVATDKVKPILQKVANFASLMT